MKKTIKIRKKLFNSKIDIRIYKMNFYNRKLQFSNNKNNSINIKKLFLFENKLTIILINIRYGHAYLLELKCTFIFILSVKPY